MTLFILIFFLIVFFSLSAQAKEYTNTQQEMETFVEKTLLANLYTQQRWNRFLSLRSKNNREPMLHWFPHEEIYAKEIHFMGI